MRLLGDLDQHTETFALHNPPDKHTAGFLEDVSNMPGLLKPFSRAHDADGSVS